MDLNAIQEKIVKAQEKLDKLNIKKSKIQVALDGGKNPYYYDERSMRNCLYDIKACEKNIEKLKEKLELETKRLSIRIPVIEEFLRQWGVKAYQFHLDELNRLNQYNTDYTMKKKQIEQHLINNGISPNYHNVEKIMKDNGMSYSEYSKIKRDKFSSVALKLENDYDWQVTLNKIIEKEIENKRNLLIERVIEVTGKVTDATQLFIADNGEINGIITGEKGSAKVNTIYAGGYNIQCLHFRVLVGKVG